MKTWCSNARWREGRKRSNSKGVLVAGLIKSASFLAFTNISSPLKQTLWWKRNEAGGLCNGILTGNNSVSKCCNLLCWPNRPLKRNTFSHLKSGYLSWSASTNSTLRRVEDAPMLFRSARVIEYQSDGWQITKATVRIWGASENLLEDESCLFYLFYFQLLFCFGDQLQEGVLRVSKSLACKLQGIPRIFRIDISESLFQGRIISPQFLRFDAGPLHRIPIWRLETGLSKKKKNW